MAQDYASSIAGASIRVTRLNANGTLATSASASYVMTSFISVSFTPEYEEGDEFTQKTAGGEVCVSFKSPDTLKRVTFEVAVCNPDPEFTQLVSGGSLLALTEGGRVDGYAAPLAGVDANPNGVAVEVWSKAIQNGKAAATNPYFHWIFPYAVLRPSGDRVIEQGIMANTFEGWALGNANFGSGPNAEWKFPAAASAPYAYARSATAAAAPTGGNGFVPITYTPPVLP